jgi:hypothetical protein
VTVGPPDRKVKPNSKNRVNLRASAHPGFGPDSLRTSYSESAAEPAIPRLRPLAYPILICPISGFLPTTAVSEITDRNLCRIDHML